MSKKIRIKYVLVLFLLLIFGCTFWMKPPKAEPVWPGNAPGESAQTIPYDDTEVPTWIYYPPKEKKSNACIVICPGGAYQQLTRKKEGTLIAKYFNRKGITAVILHYRVPRREGLPKHLAPWQDVQRTIRIVRSKANEWGIDPEKIGVIGFSAGGHLTMMAAASSQTPAYEPVDDLDRTVPCHVNFAVPVYPGYILDNGADGTNANRGEGGTLVSDFAFDDHTPPVCLIHGDKDGFSALGSTAIYKKVRSMGRPCELHIYAKTGHAFGGRRTNDHIDDWLNRVWAWMKKIEVY